MGAVFTLFLTPIIAAILLLTVVFCVLGGATLSAGGITKIFLYKSKLNIISNILLIIGYSFLWLGLFGIYPIPSAIICFILGFAIILKYHEFHLLKIYIPAIIATLCIGCPFLLETMPYLQLFLMFSWCVACLVGVIYLTFKRKVVKEMYSFVLFSEGTFATMWFLCQYYLNVVP